MPLRTIPVTHLLLRIKRSSVFVHTTLFLVFAFIFFGFHPIPMVTMYNLLLTHRRAQMGRVSTCSCGAHDCSAAAPLLVLR